MLCTKVLLYERSDLCRITSPHETLAKCIALSLDRADSSENILTNLSDSF